MNSCPFHKSGVSRTFRGLVLHLGQSEDKVHEEWRKKHQLPAKMESVNKKEFEDIKKAIYDDGNLFNPQQ